MTHIFVTQNYTKLANSYFIIMLSMAEVDEMSRVQGRF